MSIISVKSIFLYSLLLLPIGLLFGEVPTSIAEIIVFTLWLLTNEWESKLYLLKNNKYFWILSSLYFIHLLGLIYTFDFNYALNDLRIKIPLILFPIVFFSINIKSKYILLLIKWFVIVVFINLLYLWINVKSNNTIILDTRNVSIFISHIRLGIISAFAILSAIYLVINHIDPLFEKIIFIIISIVAFILMLSLGLMSGIVSLFIASIFAIFYLLIKAKNKTYFFLFSIITIIFGIVSFFYIKKIHLKYFPPVNKTIYLNTHTINNNEYYHNLSIPLTENGHYIYTHICDKELRKEWEKRSKIPFTGKDMKNNEIKYTLYRYLASKGLTKDSVGLTQLNNNDIQNIECGYPNYLYTNANILEKRIYELFQEYQYFKITQNPNRKTLILRLFYLKIAFDIWIKNFWIGVGTGDVQQAFNEQYQKYPHIIKACQLRAHNQIITFIFTFGILGFIIIFLNIFFPLFNLKNSDYYIIYYLFSIISIFSFLVDDTLETQPGATFYALFNTLLIKLCQQDKKLML